MAVHKRHTLRVLAFSTSCGIQLLASPTMTATDRAMQRWPAAPKAAPIREFNTESCRSGVHKDMEETDVSACNTKMKL
eukprot:54199-Eustigmatos_ZCMA.PRE.1